MCLREFPASNGAGPVGAKHFSFQVISPTFAVAAAFAGGLLVVDALACFAVARVFDRERLITGTKPTSGTGQPRYRARGAS